MKTLDWYFDFVSPYAYLQNAVLARVGASATIRRRPILFAGLLAHWGQLGPAEIPPKRVWTYRHCLWLARRHGIAMTMPAMHPFNPLPLLRLATALDDAPGAIDRLFSFVWVEGRLPTETDAWRALLAECGVDEAAIAAPAVKAALRRNGEDALAAGVFGVPTAVVDGEAFWGFEATDMLLEHLAGARAGGEELLVAARAVAVGPMRASVARPAA